MTLDRLYRDVENLKQQYKGLAGGPQLALASIENGAIDSMDADGNLKMTIGQQDDGGNTINVISGPTPPTPAGFTVEVDHGKFIVHWSGDFDGDKLAPSDWSRAEVHASQDPFFVPSRATARGSIVSAAGGEVTIGVLKGPWTIKMLAWSQAGKMSAPSAPVDVEVPGYGEIVLEEIDAAQTRIENAREILVDGQETLGGKLEEVDGSLTGLGQDVAAVEQAQQELEGSVSAAQQTADNAQQAAWDAESTATTAKNAADQATADAAVAAGIANGKGKVLVQSSAPGEADRNAQTLWIDTTGGANTPKRWSGTAWVAITDKTATDAAAAAVAAQSEADQAKTAADAAQQTADAAQSVASAAQTLATQAMASANSKNRITRSTSTPPTTYDGRVDDVWWVLSSLGSGGRVLSQWRWNGNVWVSELIDSAVLAYVDAAKITTGFLDVATLIRAGAITVDKILVGVPNNMVLDVVTKQGDARPHVRGDRAKQLGTQGPTSSGGIDPGRHLWAVGDERDDWGTLIELAGTDGTTLIPVEGGYTYSASMTVRLGGNYANGTGTCRLAYQEVGATGDSGPIVPLSGTEGGATWAWVERRANFKVGPGATHVRLLVQSTVNNGGLRVAFPKMQLAVGGTLIEPGGIQTPHLAADVLEVGNLKAGTAALAEAVIKKLFAEVVVARMAQAQEFIGENAILTGAVTAPKITASEELWAKIAEFVKIRAEHIEADAIDGMVITGPTIQSGRSGRRWIGDPNGIRIINEDDDVRTELSPDGSTFKGEVEAETLVVNEGAELKANNTLAQGSKLTLAAGVTDPTAPPVVQPYWGGVELDSPVDGAVGLAFDGTNYWTGKKIYTGGGGYRASMVRISPTGTVTEVKTALQWNEFWGVTCIGSELFWLYKEFGAYSSMRAMVEVTDLNCAKKREFEYPNVGLDNGKADYLPGIGNDGTNLIIAQCNDAGSLIWRFISKTDGSALGGWVNRGDATKSDITGVYVGTGDWGTKYVLVAKKSTNTIQVFGTDGEATPHSWYTDTGDVGIVFHDGKFRTLSPAGTVHEYADKDTGDNLGDWWTTYYWYTDVDSDSVIESSDYQSRMAPPKRFTWPNRAGLKILGQPLPDGVEALAPALAKNASTPVRTDFSSPGWLVDSGKPSARYVELPADWQTFASPSETNTYPNATPSSIESASSTFQVNGDGSGMWGPLTFNPDGTMSSSAVPDWVPITSFATGFSAQTWGFAPAYRVWPDGKVEWRGVIAGTINETSHPFVIPDMARPAQPVNMAAAVQAVGTEYVTRVEFCPDESPTQFRVYRGSADRTWVSLDGLTYYKS